MDRAPTKSSDASPGQAGTDLVPSPSLQPPRNAGTSQAATTTVRPPATRKGTLSHAALFLETTTVECDVCGVSLAPENDQTDSKFAVAGSGMYLWSRRGQIVREEAPLCADCGTAIGVTQIRTWTEDDGEG